VTYALTVLGAFGVVWAVEESAGEARLADFAGLCGRAAVVVVMMVFMLSLAGIPPSGRILRKILRVRRRCGS